MPSGAIESLISAGKKRLEELSIFDDVEIICVGAKQIQSGYRSATNSNSAALNFPKALTLPAHEKVDGLTLVTSKRTSFSKLFSLLKIRKEKVQLIAPFSMIM